MKRSFPKYLHRLARAKLWTVKKIAARIKLGFGQGTGPDYLPWIDGRDLSSIGTATRLWSPKTGRTMEFLSDIERNTFLVAEFRPDFHDYWEQWPLERNWTLWAAGQLGHRHSRYWTSRRLLPVIMTVDGVLTLSKNGGLVRKALDCKQSTALDNPRTKEKLAIAELACKRFAYPHKVVTEKSFSQRAIQNILWVRFAVVKPHEKAPTLGAFETWPLRLHRQLLADISDASLNGAMRVNEYCQQFDAQHGLTSGLALRCMKLLMWEHLVEFDLETADPETLTLKSLTVVNRSGTVGALGQGVVHA